jgi:adenylate cyclase
VLEKLSQTSLKDVPVLRQRLEELKPMLDYDGVFASALTGKPAILGFNLSPDQIKGACRSRCSRSRPQRPRAAGL